MSPDAEVETGSRNTELAVERGGKGGGVLQEELPCKTKLTVNAITVHVKAANTSQSKSTWNLDACTYHC